MYGTCKCGEKVPYYCGYQCMNCCKDQYKQVAAIVIEQTQQIQRMSESAADNHVVRVEPGEYAVELRVTQKGEQYLATIFTGICVAANYGNTHYPDQLGKPDQVVYMPYKYQLEAGQYWGKVINLNKEALSTYKGI